MAPGMLRHGTDTNSRQHRSVLQTLFCYSKFSSHNTSGEPPATKGMPIQNSITPGLVGDKRDPASSASDLTTLSEISKPDQGSNDMIAVPDISMASKSYLLHRSSRKRPPQVLGNKGNWLWVTDGSDVWQVYDSSGGAAVSSIGHGQAAVLRAMHKVIDESIFYAPADFTTEPAEKLAYLLAKSTNFEMGKVILYGSGSEGVEAGAKFCLQYHANMKENPETSRNLFIARQSSYHGTTLNSLDLGGHEARKKMFRSNLPHKTHHISPCYPYRFLEDGETEGQYVVRLAQELEDTIIDLGPENVAGFILEPVVGAALGCVPAVPGYLKAMKDVCHKYGVLIIFDEVMCGMGRTGFLHAWQAENVVPDIQIIGKGLGGGYSQISAMLINKRLADEYDAKDDIMFNHGHTFQNSPLPCSAALAVQEYIMDNNLISNIAFKGAILKGKLVEALASHPYVGDIRGTPGFIGIEFVSNKATKESFPSTSAVAWRIHERGLGREHGIYVYAGSGSSKDGRGDYLMIAPAYNIDDQDIDIIVERVTKLIFEFFDSFNAQI